MTYRRGSNEEQVFAAPVPVHGRSPDPHLTYRGATNYRRQRAQPGPRDMGALARRRRTGSGSRRHLGYALASRQATARQALRAARRRRRSRTVAELAARLVAGRLAQVDGACPRARCVARRWPLRSGCAARRTEGRECGHGEGTRGRHRNRHRAIRLPHSRAPAATVITSIERGGARGAARRQAGAAAPGSRRGRR